MQEAAADTKETRCQPYKDHFKTPLVISSVLSFGLKVLLGVIGAMMSQSDVNVFSNLIFSKHLQDTVLITLAILILAIVLPSAVE